MTNTQRKALGLIVKFERLSNARLGALLWGETRIRSAYALPAANVAKSLRRLGFVETQWGGGKDGHWLHRPTIAGRERVEKGEQAA